MTESILYSRRKPALGESTMAIGEKDLERIGEYVESKLPQWLEKISHESGRSWLFAADRALFERVVHIDEQLTGIERRMDERFEQFERRFEQVDKRFEDVNKRFEDMNKRFTSTQWLIGILVTLFMAVNTAIQML